MLKHILILAVAVVAVCGHGRLLDPPGRSTIWKDPDFSRLNLPANYNDNELFCGGYQVQYNANGGRCGICGDNYADPIPRANENHGTYGRGIISRNYNVGSVIASTIEITSNHLGYITFAVCPQNTDGSENPDTCQTLRLADGSGDKLDIGSTYGQIRVNLRLPEGLTCRQCTFQWTYVTGNSWGYCDEAKTYGQLGCGDQEVFRGCADISIV